MNSSLKVSSDKLKSTASAFQATGTQVKNLTTQMTTTVTSLSGDVWSGDASTKYVNKFKGLSDDIQRIIKMINEHVTDLNEMANAYEKAESANVATAESLSSDVIV